MLRLNEFPEVKVENKETATNSKTKVNLVFCLPGAPANRKIEFLDIQTAAFFQSQGIQTVRISPEWNVANVYSARNGCMGNTHRADQKPFEDRALEYEYMIWQDSDQEVTYRDILQLLSHAEPIVFGWTNMLPDLDGTTYVNCGFITAGKYRRITEYELNCLPKNAKGIVEVDWAGFAVVAIQYGVMESLDYPWFQSWIYNWEDNGIEMADVMADDAGWCYRVKAQGFKILVDPACKVGHFKAQTI